MVVMPKYIPTIGLEIHAELKTESKMFCDSRNDPNETHPNATICPVCTGQPGSLPTVNKKAVEYILKIGMALNGDIPQTSKFDRKNYFYPDLPKGWQISQYDVPLIFGGMLNGVRLRRIHLEEDTAKLAHAKSGSLLDYNRAGRPLMELVTEPDIKNADQAVEFAKELQLILRYLDIADANMEKGQMRVEANVSLGEEKNGKIMYGTKVEVKNIASFKAVHDAIQYELKRQEQVLKAGEKVVQETRGWNDAKGMTISQRLKEEAQDYRYFPEPDLPPLDLSHFTLSELKREIPELPAEKRRRFAEEYGLTPERADFLVNEPTLADYFEKAVSELAADDNANLKDKVAILFNYLTSDLKGLLMEREFAITDVAPKKITPENFADLMQLIFDKKVLSRGAKDILGKMLETGLDPNRILEEEGLEAVSDEGALEETVRKIVEENPGAIEDYKKGKENALQFLVGKAMVALRGRGNPETLKELIRKRIV